MLSPGAVKVEADAQVDVEAPTINSTATVKATTTAPVIEATAATSATIAAPTVSLVAGSSAMTVTEAGVAVGEGNGGGALVDNGYSQMLSAALGEIVLIGTAAGQSTTAIQALISAVNAGTFTSSKFKTDM